MYEVKFHGITVDTKLQLEQAISILSASKVSKFFKQLYLLKSDGTKSLVVFTEAPAT